jgi:DNA-directed RNA polymerase specialized sigma24 family protein
MPSKPALTMCLWHYRDENVNEQSTSIITPSLEAYVSATNESESAEMLAALLDQVIDPQIRSLVRNKLHVTLRTADDSKANQDALDLVGDIRGLILKKLGALRAAATGQQIADLDAYVRTVAANSINHSFRQRYPRRLRLKNQLRYLLSHDARFAIWQDAHGDWLCGMAGCTETAVSPSRLFDHAARAFENSPGSLENSDISEIVRKVFDGLTGAAHFRDLVSVIYDLWRIEEPSEVAEEAGYNAVDRNWQLQEKLEQGAFLKAIWDAIGELPVRHRAALLLNLRDRDGDGLIALLPATRVASIAEIARQLEFPLEQFAAIWHELPWDDNRIAQYLGLTRQQVINLRQSARATLRRRMNY